MPAILRLTNDDEPGKLSPRTVSIRRTDLTVEGQDAALAMVDPALKGDGWGDGTSLVILIARIRGVSVRQVIDEPERRPGRVFVCRYLGDASQMPVNLARSDVHIEFWGLLE